MAKRTYTFTPAIARERRESKTLRQQGLLEMEAMDLQASDIACTLADAWVTYTKNLHDFQARNNLGLALEKLEIITRLSAMRKVRP
jgi:hypothetical protein